MALAKCSGDEVAYCELYAVIDIESFIFDVYLRGTTRVAAGTREALARCSPPTLPHRKGRAPRSVF